MRQAAGCGEDAFQQMLISLLVEQFNQCRIDVTTCVANAAIDLVEVRHFGHIGVNFLADEDFGIADALIQRVEELEEHVSVYWREDKAVAFLAVRNEDRVLWVRVTNVHGCIGRLLPGRRF